MDQIDYDTEQSLFAGADTSASEQVDLDAQRRLIRKALPDLPLGDHGNATGGQSLILGRTGSPRQNVLSLEKSRERAKKISVEEQKQLDWWPSTSRHRQHIQEIEPTVQRHEQEPASFTLGDRYQRHLLLIIRSSLSASGWPNEDLAKAIFDALLECLAALSRAESMRALQQSYSFLWKVEAMVRATEELNYSKTSKKEGRWPRLPGWPTSISSGSHLSSTDARRRKRDIALQLLGSALRFNGGVPGIEQSEEEVNEACAESEPQAIEEKAVVKRPPGSAPRLLVKTSMPTIALQTSSGSESVPFRPSEADTAERASHLTTRLEMQLKNSPKAPLDSGDASKKDNEAVMAVCRVCLDFSSDAEVSSRKRSGTVTLNSDRRENNASKMSTLSDQTIRERRQHSTVGVAWKADHFTGSPLLLNPLSSEIQGRGEVRPTKQDSQLQLIGGTFVVVSTEEEVREQEDVIRATLNIGLYAACAMMMESALLYDLGLEIPVEEKQEETPEHTEKTLENDAQGATPATPFPTTEPVTERQSRWGWSLSKKAFGYSGRLGKMMGVLAGNAGKQTLSISEAEQAQERDVSETLQTTEPLPVDSVDAERQESDLSAFAISPYYDAEIRESGEKGKGDDYTESLLSQQTISLSVLEGKDLSLSTSRRKEQQANMVRSPLLTRNSSFDSTDHKTDGSVSSAASQSIRSSNQYRQAEPSTTPRSSASPPNIETTSDDQSNRNVHFYQRDQDSSDLSLGQAIEELSAKASLLNQQRQAVKKPKEAVEQSDASAGHPRGHRVAQYLHGHDRISVMACSVEGLNEPTKLASEEAPRVQEGEAVVDYLVADSTTEKTIRQDMTLWTANVKTGEESDVKIMSEATYLSSYGAFLQSILSHPRLARQKHAVVQIVQFGSTMIKFQVQPVIVFDLLVEGPVVLSKLEQRLDLEATTDKKDAKLIERTRMEIQNFYSSIKRHVSALEHVLVARELDEKGKTIKPSALMSKTSISSLQRETANIDKSTASAHDDRLYPSSNSLKLLSKLKKAFRDAEFELYDGVKMSRASSINDVRMQFQSRARSTKKRLSVWEEKHLSKKEVQQLDPLDCLEPDYFEQQTHVFPGSRYLFREDEPLSMIAYTLSSREFDAEMHGREERHANVLDWRTSVLAPSTQSQLSVSQTSTHTTSPSASALDPDEDVDFDTAELLQVRTKRKKRVKDKDGGILSLTLRRANSNISSQSDQTPLATPPADDRDAVLDESDETTPTVSQITSSNFDTVSSSNDTFQAQVAHLAVKSSLGSMFDGNSTAPPTPSEETRPILPTDDSKLIPSTAREASDATTLPIPDATQRRAVSQPVKSTPPDQKAAPISPHIKHSIVSGSMKVSCVSWFAEDFAKLRKMWKIDDEYIQSMSRCKSRSTMGGKSKSGFYITNDGKWIAKQLLDVWITSEREAFLEFAPAYLRYMMNSAVNDCPTLLVKIAGVYTLKIKDIKTGEVKLRMSVQVLENVFAGDGGDSIRFDVKGIRDRRVQIKKEPQQQDETERAPVWWDGEWIDCFQARAYVPRSHKAVFQRAMNNDLAFLTASNVMDYSLLIGAQEGDKGAEDDVEARPTFRVRIVDFLGAFTLAKAIESSGKRAMKSQAPTILPPSEYAARFEKNIKTYFTSCAS